ncbi:MAG: DUF3048 domain-containing protein [Ruminococcaceae bacterium]|nr:DUF3048 domain-containing protein [Oscillospiraceae bacterium]
MKKIFLLLLIFVIILSGCNVSEPVDVMPSELPTATPEPTLPPESDSRIIAVMVDNDNNDARPHAGVDEAFLIYEAYVEGSATRMMALFKDADTEKIGPIRSSRHYFLDYAMEHDAIYVHYGWSPQASKDISTYGINNINGVLEGNNVFWRDSTYTKSWHTAYASIEKIMKFSDETKKYRNTSNVSNFKKTAVDKEITGESAIKITLPYAGFYKASYEYDEATNTYKRYINGKGHITQEGVHLSPKNIIIQKASNFTIPGDTSGRQDVKTVGTGEGYLITGGKIARITWSKPDRKTKTTYKFENGEEICLNPGQTWIQIVPPSMDISIEALNTAQ